MSAEETDSISLENPRFYRWAFRSISKEKKGDDPLLHAVREQYVQISELAERSLMQDPVAIRSVQLARRLANLLIDESGMLLVDKLPELTAELEKRLFSIGPNRQSDALFRKHILYVLKALQEDKELVRLVQSASKPQGNRFADQIVRDTLQLPANIPITDAHVKRAVLSAWLTFLRQTVGSCFATAPAVLIQQEQPAQMLRDLVELLATGRLKRTYGGVEYTVPFSTSWGTGDLKRPIYIPPGYLMEHLPLWDSPGLIKALDTIKCIHEEPDKQGLKKRVLKILQEKNKGEQGIYLTPEALIDALLMDWLELDAEQVAEYQRQPKNSFQNGLLYMAGAQESGVRSSPVSVFFSMRGHAFSAFKAMADNALLKAWEFTLASLSESKLQFARWNLYSSLGLSAQETGGIGFALYEFLKERIDQCNRQVEEIQKDYELLFAQLKALEVRIKHASTEQESKWISVEYQAKRNEFYTLEAMRDDWQFKAKKLAEAFDQIIDIYDALFPQYFQEVYDAEMQDFKGGIYDDSPAGFRLLYKHGRSSTAQWTPITSPQEFVDALASFFVTSESEMRHHPNFQGLDEEIGQVVTKLVLHVRTEQFLETALYRMARAHHTSLPEKPLENLDLVEKKPWSYTSGGTLTTMVMQYYKRETPPAENARWVENPTELLVFLIDMVKQLPAKQQEEFQKNPDKNMLMHSPTHAFNFKPGWKPFHEAAQHEQLTYTWVRDQWIAPRQHFWDSLWLDFESARFLTESWLSRAPAQYRHQWAQLLRDPEADIRSFEWRSWLVDRLHLSRQAAGEVDSWLYEMLPLCHYTQLKERMQQMFEKIFPDDKRQQIACMHLFEKHASTFHEPFIGAKQFQEICLGILCLLLKQPLLPEDPHSLVYKSAADLGFAPPPPILIADTNWLRVCFGFTVNPGTNALELWRIDSIGKEAAPMVEWQQWLNGSKKDRTWGVFYKTWEYAL